MLNKFQQPKNIFNRELIFYSYAEKVIYILSPKVALFRTTIGEPMLIVHTSHMWSRILPKAVALNVLLFVVLFMDLYLMLKAFVPRQIEVEMKGWTDLANHRF